MNLDHLEAQASKEGVGKLDPARRVASQMKFDTGNTGAVTLEEIGRWIDAEHPGGKNGRTKAGFGQLFQIGADTTKAVTVNGVEKQKGDLSEMIWNVPEIIAKMSQQVALSAGDIIMTGTPAGVGPVEPGDKIECGIDGLGTLKVTIGKPA